MLISITISGATGTTAVQVENIIRTDTGQTVIAGPVNLAYQGNGTFTYNFTDPAPNLTYQYVWTEIRPDGSTLSTVGTASSTGAVTGITISITGTIPITSVTMQKIIRLDNSNPLLTTPTLMQNNGDGTWTFAPFVPPAGVGYAYTYTILRSDDSSTTNTQIVGGLLPTSVYTNWNSFLRRWGIVNVAVASNKDTNPGKANPTPDFASCQQAFAYADDLISSHFRDYGFAIPLIGNGGTVPSTIAKWATDLAFIYLYDTRGWDEKDRVANRLKKLQEEIFGQMQAVRIRAMNLDLLAISGDDSDDRSVGIVKTSDILLDRLQSVVFPIGDWSPIYPGSIV